MGIRDTLKSLRGGDKDGDRNQAEQDITDVDAPDPTWFQPRFDGSYLGGAASAGPGMQVVLRFLPGGKVLESSTAASGSSEAPGFDQQNPCRGEYTPAGRFTVQRQFERIISYAVLEMEPEGFLARRINGADRSTAELHFTFAPAGASAAG